MLLTKIKWIKARKSYTLQTAAAKCLIPPKAKIMVARGATTVPDLLEDSKGMVTIKVANPTGKTVEIINMIMVMAVVRVNVNSITTITPETQFISITIYSLARLK